MGQRLDLDTTLRSILNSNNTYFQPPPKCQLKYPCIVYSLYDIYRTTANNELYGSSKVYELTLIDSDPDTELVDKILALPYCSFVRYFANDNLNHYIFNLYY